MSENAQKIDFRGPEAEMLKFDEQNFANFNLRTIKFIFLSIFRPYAYYMNLYRLCIIMGLGWILGGTPSSTGRGSDNAPSTYTC